MKKLLFTSILLLAFLISGCTANSNNTKTATIILPYYEEVLDDDYIESLKNESHVYDVNINKDEGLAYLTVSSEYLEECKLEYTTEFNLIVEEVLEDLSDSVTYIQTNEDMTVFEIYLSTEEISTEEFFLVSGLLQIGMEYQGFLGKNPLTTNVYVKVLNDNNELIEEFVYPEFYENIDEYFERYISFEYDYDDYFMEEYHDHSEESHDHSEE